MIQLRTILKPADNCGAKRLRVIHGKTPKGDSCLWWFKKTVC